LEETEGMFSWHKTRPVIRVRLERMVLGWIRVHPAAPDKLLFERKTHRPEIMKTLQRGFLEVKQ